MNVIFTYDEDTQKWDPTVHGVVSLKEAKEAFAAVVLSCQQLNPRLLNHSRTQVIDSFNIRIHPAV